MPVKSKVRQPGKRNGNLFDTWSIVHLCTGIAMGWLMAPFAALLLMVLWEPLEIFILSPLLGKIGIEFGYETINNSLSDIVFDSLGILIGAYLLGALFDPPFYLFG
jgi:hypothetical protein